MMMISSFGKKERKQSNWKMSMIKHRNRSLSLSRSPDSLLKVGKKEGKHCEKQRNEEGAEEGILQRERQGKAWKRREEKREDTLPAFLPASLSSLHQHLALSHTLSPGAGCIPYSCLCQ